MFIDQYPGQQSPERIPPVAEWSQHRDPQPSNVSRARQQKTLSSNSVVFIQSLSSIKEKRYLEQEAEPSQAETMSQVLRN